MTTATLRNEGNTVVLPIPTPILEQANLKAGAQVDIEIEGGKIVMAPKARPQYSLAELMAQCDLSRPLTEEEREWLDAPTVGGEEI